MPVAQALAIIGENLDSQFDGAWGRRFIDLGQRGELDHIVGHSEPGLPLQTCPACGPIVVIQRHQADGALVHCRHCGGELKVSRSGDAIGVAPTGRRGNAAALEPQVDAELHEELVAIAAACLRQFGQG